MNTADKKILNNYFGFLDRLNTSMKLGLIEKLTQSVKSKSGQKSEILSAFGAWGSDESAEELIDFLHLNRSTNRNIEEL